MSSVHKELYGRLVHEDVHMIGFLVLSAKAQRSPGGQSEVVLVSDGVLHSGWILGDGLTLSVPLQFYMMRRCLLAEVGKSALSAVSHHPASLHVQINEGPLILVIGEFYACQSIGVHCHVGLYLIGTIHLGSGF